MGVLHERSSLWRFPFLSAHLILYPPVPSLFLPPLTCFLPPVGPGDASGGGGSRGRDPQRLLHETRQILEPVCPGLRPLLRGLAGNDSQPAGSDTQPPLPPTAPEPPGPADGPPRGGGLKAAGAEVGGGGDGGAAAATAAGFPDQESEIGGGDAADSVLDYGGDGSRAFAGAAPGGGGADVLEGADGLFQENSAAGASEDVGGGAREVFDRPVQSSAPSPLSTGRPLIV